MFESGVLLFERGEAVLERLESELVLSEVLVPEFELVLEECYLFFTEFKLLSKGFYFLVVCQQGKLQLVDVLIGLLEFLLQFVQLLVEILAMGFLLLGLVLHTGLQFFIRGK